MYVAMPASEPVSSSIRGKPSTYTSSSNETVTLILEAMPYVPSSFGDETDSTLGAAVSMRMPAAASERPSSTPDRSRSALLPTVSVMVPLSSDRASAPS